MCRYSFYSPLISSAQRLPNGNTLITEGSGGRMIEVTSEHELVWEYISPYYGMDGKSNYVYRAYRVPYEWVPRPALRLRWRYAAHIQHLLPHAGHRLQAAH